MSTAFDMRAAHTDPGIRNPACLTELLFDDEPVFTPPDVRNL